MPADQSFFDESLEQSQVKATIVEKYFDAWAGIIIGAKNAYRPHGEERIAYIDLFAGPGRYKDGAVSTPLRVLQKAIAKSEYARRLVAVFNDKDSENTAILKDAISRLEGIRKLKFEPIVWNQDVGDGIARSFEDYVNIPTLAFVDPWGYRGLTLNLVNSFLQNWGCDCIFFFNYARINAGLSNPAVHEHMCALFGQSKAVSLAKELEPLRPSAREATIVNALAQALKGFGHRYVLPFCFRNKSGKRTSHHLILVTKAFKGYEVMKEIMAKSSTSETQGVPSFTYSPADSSAQQLLFDLTRPLDDLKEAVLRDFAGRRLTMRKLYEEHSVDRPYVASNYKHVLSSLEQAGAITTEGRKSSRGFANDIIITIPPRSD